MRVFVTGATGFVGSTVMRDLMRAGHSVVGLARSEGSATALREVGAEVQVGDLENLESLRDGAAKSDGVIHLGFIHDFSRFAEVCAHDRRVVEVMGEALAGTDRPLVVTSGVAIGCPGPGQLAVEDHFDDSHAIPRIASEEAVNAVVGRGGRAMVVRLPQVHDQFKQGLVTYLIAVAKAKGVSAYVGEGLNRWAAVHRTDAAPVYRLALENGPAGARYHAVSEEGVSLREVAEALGRRMNLPVRSLSPDEAADHFGSLAHFATLDMAASSTLTRQRLGWHPTSPTSLIDDLDHLDDSAL